MATHSSVLAWRIPGTGEPGGLPSMGSHRVGHDWSDSAAAAADHIGAFGPELMGFWVTMGITPLPPPRQKKTNTLKGNSLLARYFPTSGKKQKWNKPRRSVLLSRSFCCTIKNKKQKTGSCYLSFQGSEVRSTWEKSICTKWWNCPIPSRLKAWCSPVFLSNKCPLWRFPPQECLH